VKTMSQVASHINEAKRRQDIGNFNLKKYFL
jgi:hypothetical protein